MPGLISILDLDRQATEVLLDRAQAHQHQPPGPTSANLSIGLLFYDPSLRTRFGFHAAAQRLGITAIDVTTPVKTPRMTARERLDDVIRSVGSYCDALCIRHDEPEAITIAATLTSTPIVNCGNGADEHPTQALIDLHTIRSLRGELDGTRVVMIGDLRHMRSAHSLLLALGSFEGVHVRCISPAGLEMAHRYAARYQQTGNTLEESTDPDFSEVDIIYVAGFPPHTPIGSFSEQERDPYCVTRDRVEPLGQRVHILSPLPRIDEIDDDVDDLESAKYFYQSSLGLPIRIAVLEQVLGLSDSAA